MRFQMLQNQMKNSL